MAHRALTQLGATRRRNLAEEGLVPNWMRRVELLSMDPAATGKHAPYERSATQQGQWARDIPDTYPVCACGRHTRSSQQFGALTCDKMGSGR